MRHRVGGLGRPGYLQGQEGRQKKVLIVKDPVIAVLKDGEEEPATPLSPNRFVKQFAKTYLPGGAGDPFRSRSSRTPFFLLVKEEMVEKMMIILGDHAAFFLRPLRRFWAALLHRGGLRNPAADRDAQPARRRAPACE